MLIETHAIGRRVTCSSVTVDNWRVDDLLFAHWVAFLRIIKSIDQAFQGAVNNIGLHLDLLI